MEMEMDQSLDDEQSLSEEDAAMGEAPVRGVERASAEHDNTVGVVQQQHSQSLVLYIWIYDGPVIIRWARLKAGTAVFY